VARVLQMDKDVGGNLKPVVSDHNFNTESDTEESAITKRTGPV